MRAIATWIDGINKPLDEQAEAAINSILSTYAKRSQITLVALAHFHLKKVIDWMDQAEKAEELLRDYLTDPAKAATLSPEELRRTIELHHKRINSAIDQIQQLVEKIPSLPKAVHEDEDRKVQKLTQGQMPVFETVAKRERARNLLTWLEGEGMPEAPVAEVIEVEPIEEEDSLLTALQKKIEESSE